MARKQKNKVVKDNAERWLLTYADMITLLMLFFIVLYALSTQDARKYTIIAKSLNKAFAVEVLTSAITPITEAETAAGAKLLEQIQAEQAGSLQDKQLATIVDQIVVDAGTYEQVTTSYSSEGVVISILGSLLFQSGKAELRPEGQQTLGGISTLLAKMPYDVRVEGHTDDLAPNSVLYRNNLELSLARSYSVALFLGSSGIPKEKLSAAGFGETRPRAANDTAEHRALNRRIDIVVLSHQVKLTQPPVRQGRP